MVAIRDFEGNTFIAFIDISGFKNMMKNGNQALDALDAFYSIGYGELKQLSHKDVRVEGIFISDSGIIFTRKLGKSVSALDELRLLLEVVQTINQRMLASNFMLTTSITYGFFKYKDRIDLEVIKKNALWGGAYMEAYRDNSTSLPKLAPGQCRIVKEGLPEEVLSYINRPPENDPPPPKDVLRLIKTFKSKKHYYYWWMANQTEQLQSYESTYNKLDELMYWGLLQKLKQSQIGKTLES